MRGVWVKKIDGEELPDDIEKMFEDIFGKDADVEDSDDTEDDLPYMEDDKEQEPADLHMDETVTAMLISLQAEVAVLHRFYEQQLKAKGSYKAIDLETIRNIFGWEGEKDED